MRSESPSGILYIVATPIGNLSDMTYRAVQVLQQADLIMAEDTRHSRPLLDHYGVEGPLSTVHEHNERQRSEYLVKRLLAGENIALISDAGTPLISDPGYPLVHACREAGVQVVPIPGPCAAIAALSAAGLPTDRFLFVGFLAAKSAARVSQLTAVSEESGTLVFYESPRRILSTLRDMQDVYGADRQAVVAREVTKQFETFLAGSLSSLIEQVAADSNQQRGEIVIMVHGARRAADALPADATRLLLQLLPHMALKKAAAVVAEHYGVRKNQLYQWGLEQQEGGQE
ncbi:16S rRNA (cytidine(1402)-2'-O)-methyltransferase [Aliidiomarina sedimenti]|uniref:Ribosomal RNA small subunit methyltransferase I n=1 Tax=Aliidiomarina sedimenti TaxID=1933879 RepID=A0ABY0C020_9GAMM|nr:16S rRNA (cytidine(1402)-2'-O)-methyltransferase [Aliidiomarina sedimenti]RUO30575.1 16S rRNA (cytidine(1402)-2'-O)-methyltransferase [Aliidiomarina sedimenti]